MSRKEQPEQTAVPVPSAIREPGFSHKRSAVKAIIFDYFGVIASDEYWNFVGADRDDTSEWLHMAESANLGKLHWRDFMRALAERTGKSFEDVAAMYKREMINPQLVAFALELKEHFNVGLISNAHYEFLEPVIQAAGLESVFDPIIISSRVGLIKPDPRIFALALEKLGVEPAEAVMIDDTARNVEGARAAGLRGILYQNLGQLKTGLTKILG